MAWMTLNGNRTWVKAPKSNKPVLVLLHGGLSSSAGLLHGVGRDLSRHFAIAAFDRRGHGRTPDNGDAFSYVEMANESIEFLESIKKPVDLLGYSDGGNVALIVALKRPDLVRRMILVGANFHFDGLVPGAIDPDDEVAKQSFVEKYVASHPGTEAEAESLFARTIRMFQTQPTFVTHDLKNVTTPTLVVSGDDDVVALQHTVLLFESLRYSQLLVVPGASHAVLKERPKLMAREIKRFLRGPIVPFTLMPMRRRRF